MMSFGKYLREFIYQQAMLIYSFLLVLVRSPGKASILVSTEHADVKGVSGIPLIYYVLVLIYFSTLIL